MAASSLRQPHGSAHVLASTEKQASSNSAGLFTQQQQYGQQQRRKGFLGTLDRHQIDGPLFFILTIMSIYVLFPTSFAKKFLFFQEYDAITATYEKSWNDTYFVIFWVAAFTFLRASVMTYILTPMARNLGANSERSVVRFAEQGWICIYYSCSWVLGMYCIQLTPTWNNWFVWFHSDQFFHDYPLTALPVITKYYYYLQFAFWLQQMFVLFIEAPRKDFLATVCHHIVTVSLITFSLALNVTTFGTAVFVSMDLADIVLSFGKCFKYIEMPDSICDPIFACFMIIWIYTRHFLYGHIIYAWIVYGSEYYSQLTHRVVIVLLFTLQSLMFFWLWSIFRIVYKMFATKGGVVDDRSEDEEELAEDNSKRRDV
ncbi:sphingosine N-acyltransferase lag1 [Lobosporangium transversale]|uniref:TLC domain-domain-containing protein n=1 Tax=Lobosporangium transversale TaxID=64571 RepID=A0A1Y2GP84_9FUNG|nr:TLC domain-domain-containing protein [Lobosporangium transversale]KAF9899789.1 sphingosine N-acyltransferase lag1 [Lobosporangium transversale]ORZ14929.1 TLC domain-domain-containing protein [Lobosporangium transversale]|eukprot:XP_021881061.1 TLC domain-domain-containing protein [Lobosporangium transversale]